MDLLKRLILYIVDQIQASEGMTSKIRIVKLLYLIDVAHYRMYGKLLTNLDWIFYRYGPYAFTIDNAIDQLGFVLGEEEVTTARGHPAYIYRVDEEQSLEDIVAFATQAMIDRTIDRWALEDTRFLLDYVYTDTEPMRSASFGEKLDFSRIQRGFHTHRPSRHLKLSEEKSSVVQELLRERHRRPPQQQSPPPRYDESYQEAMRRMNREEERRQSIIGRVTLPADSADTISRQAE